MVLYVLLLGTNLGIHIFYGYPITVILFSVLFFIFMTYVLLLSIDLITQETVQMKVKVIEIDDRLLKVVKPNGKKRTIRIAKNDLHPYLVNQEIELILTKRTKQILSIQPSK